MRKLHRRESQVSQDFSTTLKAVVQTAIETERNLNDSKRFHDSITGTSIRNKISRGESTKSFNSRNDRIYRRTPSRKSINDEKVSLQTDFSKGNENEEKILTKPDVLPSIESLTLCDTKPQHYNIPNYLKSLLAGNMKYVGPFESTSMYNMSFALTIILENQERFYVDVRNYHTIDKIISVISKKKTLKHKEVSLYYENTRLENHATVSWYGIISKSHIYVKILKKIKINGRYLDKIYPISIYTSEIIIDIKELFSVETEIDAGMMHLTYNNITLEDSKYVFFYDIKDEDEINIKLILNENSNDISVKMNPGLEIVRSYIKMTNSLETCSCKERRQNEIAYTILALINKKNIKEHTPNILNEFDKNFHHTSCFKSKPRGSTCSSISATSPSVDSEISSEDISLDECIFAEIERVDLNKKIIIEEKDLQFLCSVKSFNEFKHFLKAKIGTTCNLRSVAMLYKYALEMVRYIGAEEGENSNVKDILNNIKLYFQRYFEKEIIAKGGMGGLTLTDSDIED